MLRKKIDILLKKLKKNKNHCHPTPQEIKRKKGKILIWSLNFIKSLFLYFSSLNY